jgi:hypothetical protein
MTTSEVRCVLSKLVYLTLCCSKVARSNLATVKTGP